MQYCTTLNDEDQLELDVMQFGHFWLFLVHLQYINLQSSMESLYAKATICNMDGSDCSLALEPGKDEKSRLRETS